MSGVQFVTDENGRKVGVFGNELVSESRRKERSIPYYKYRANRLKCAGSRD